MINVTAGSAKHDSESLVPNRRDTIDRSFRGGRGAFAAIPGVAGALCAGILVMQVLNCGCGGPFYMPSEPFQWLHTTLWWAFPQKPHTPGLGRTWPRLVGLSRSCPDFVGSFSK